MRIQGPKITRIPCGSRSTTLVFALVQAKETPAANATPEHRPSYLEQVHSLGVHLRYEGVEGAGQAGRERLPQDAGAAGPVGRTGRPQQLEDMVQLVRLKEWRNR